MKKIDCIQKHYALNYFYSNNTKFKVIDIYIDSIKQVGCMKFLKIFTLIGVVSGVASTAASGGECSL